MGTWSCTALESHPQAFGATADEDRLASGRDGETVVAGPGQSAVFGAYENQALVGMAGLARATRAKRRHKAIIWGMYVEPSAREKGDAEEFRDQDGRRNLRDDAFFQIPISSWLS
jgi:acetyltransferase (GNAT) family protein